MNKIKKMLPILLTLMVFSFGTVWAAGPLDTVVNMGNNAGQGDHWQYVSGAAGKGAMTFSQEFVDKSIKMAPHNISHYLTTGSRIYLSGLMIKAASDVAPHLAWFSTATGYAYEGDYGGATITTMNGIPRTLLVSAAGTGAGLWAAGVVGGSTGSVVGPLGTAAGFLIGMGAAYLTGYVWDETGGVVADAAIDLNANWTAESKYSVYKDPKETIRSSTLTLGSPGEAQDRYWEQSINGPDVSLEEKAKKAEQLRAEKIAQLAGVLSGGWSGKDENGWKAKGSFKMSISASGRVSGKYSGDSSGNLRGIINSSGRMDIKSGGGSVDGGRWEGSIRKTESGGLIGSGSWSAEGYHGGWRGSGK